MSIATNSKTNRCIRMPVPWFTGNLYKSFQRWVGEYPPEGIFFVVDSWWQDPRTSDYDMNARGAQDMPFGYKQIVSSILCDQFDQQMAAEEPVVVWLTPEEA
jgi:hypothetical protein